MRGDDAHERPRSAWSLHATHMGTHQANHQGGRPAALHGVTTSTAARSILLVAGETDGNLNVRTLRRCGVDDRATWVIPTL